MGIPSPGVVGGRRNGYNVSWIDPLEMRNGCHYFQEFTLGSWI